MDDHFKISKSLIFRIMLISGGILFFGSLGFGVVYVLYKMFLDVPVLALLMGSCIFGGIALLAGITFSE